MAGKKKLKLDVQKAVEMYEQGMSLRDIATSLGCGANTIKRKLLAQGITLRNKNHSAKLKNSWWQNKLFLERKYVDDLLSTTEIGNLVGVSSHTIHHWLTKFEIETRPVGGAYKKGTTMSAESRIKMSKAKQGMFLGSSNPNWKGAEVSDDVRERRSYDAKQWRLACRERDGNKCSLCNSTERLHVHHILSFKDYPERRWDINNGQTVCASCHEKIHNRSFPAWVTGVENVKELPIKKIPKKEKQRFNVNDRILIWLHEGNSISTLAKMFNVGAKTISRILQANDIDTYNKTFLYIPNQDLLRRIYEIKTMKECAAHFNVSETLVHAWLKHYNIEKRNHGERPVLSK